jgi:hypothetical protein
VSFPFFPNVTGSPVNLGESEGRSCLRRTLVHIQRGNQGNLDVEMGNMIVIRKSKTSRLSFASRQLYLYDTEAPRDYRYIYSRRGRAIDSLKTCE